MVVNHSEWISALYLIKWNIATYIILFLWTFSECESYVSSSWQSSPLHMSQLNHVVYERSPKKFSYNNARSCFLLLVVTAVDLWYGAESKEAVIVHFIYYTLLIISSSLGVVISVMKVDNHHSYFNSWNCRFKLFYHLTRLFIFMCSFEIINACHPPVENFWWMLK